MTKSKNDIAIVTGASSGIGKAIAELLASSNIITVLFDINLQAAQAVADDLCDQGNQAHAKAVDISDEGNVMQAVQSVRDAIGVPSMVCHCAAMQDYGRFENQSSDVWRKMIDVNLSGCYYISKAVLPSLLETEGSLVNFASLAGKIGLPYDVAYSASKGGVIAMSKALAKEYADREVRINVIAPGAVDTPMFAMATPEDINPKVLGVIPRTARPAAEPNDIASLALYLLRDAPPAMTGSVVSIDGAAG